MLKPANFNPMWMFSLLLVVVSFFPAGAIRAEEAKPAAPAATKVESEAVSATAGQPAKPEELEAALRQRAERYWAARQARDVRTLYDMESAAQPGGWLKLEDAMSLRGLPVRKVKIETIQIEGERASVKLSGEVNIGTFGWTPQTLQDPWVLLNGQWYHETTR